MKNWRTSPTSGRKETRATSRTPEFERAPIMGEIDLEDMVIDEEMVQKTKQANFEDQLAKIDQAINGEKITRMGVLERAGYSPENMGRQPGEAFKSANITSNHILTRARGVYSSNQGGPILLEIAFGLIGLTTADEDHFDVSFKASNVRVEDQTGPDKNKMGNLLKRRKGKGQQTRRVIKFTEGKAKENTPTKVEADS